jgi:dTDP-4-dehydrorhamnose 3,5-epimerase
MRFSETGIPGCYEVQFPAHRDSRGVFVKVVHSSTFAAQGLNASFVETFYTVSGENVLRGMHLQLPPADHSKLVYCVAGNVLDVALDLRMGSPAFGKFEAVELSADKRNALYLPGGVAHGFHVRHAPAIMVYHTTSEHVISLDSGVRWDSFGAPWNAESPVVSARDSALPTLRDFRTPFEFEAVVCERRE